MAKCDEGYRCEVCGEDVTSIVESDLYLRFVIGQLDPERLHTTPDRHLRCNPVLAQYIDDPRFPPVEVRGEFAAAELDRDFVCHQTGLVSRGYRRLWEIAQADERDVTQYPLPEVADRYRQ